jgi:cell division protein FtsQ
MTTTISMDPRIRARREQVEAEASRIRVHRLVWVALGLVVLVGAGALSLRSPLLDVNEVRVLGVSQTNPETIRAVSGIAAGDTLLEVDMATAAAAIAELPWVDEVSTERSIRGAVSFTVTEREPVAQAQINGQAGYAIVDADGRVLTTQSEPRPELVTISAARGSMSPGGWLASGSLEAVAVADALRLPLGEKIDSIVINKSGTLNLYLNREVVGEAAAGGVILIGSIDEVDAKVLAIETILAQVDLACLAVLDVQVPTVPVITRTC